MAREDRRIDKFSVILSNYNSNEYIEESLLSIFNQDYGNVELIIADDGSPIFDRKKVDKVIDENKRNNISNIKILINKENLGTVKTMNNALKEATGKYVLILASDDALASNTIISDYVNTFNKYKQVNVITSNWIQCDENLNPICLYQKKSYMKKFNRRKVKKEYERLFDSNIYGAGSTCYRMDVFKKYGYYDENYRLLEDWPYYFKLTKNGERFYYIDKNGLFHRSGGVSTGKITNTKKILYNELLYLYDKEMLKEFDHIPYFSRMNAINSYIRNLYSFKDAIDISEYKSRLVEYLKKHRKQRIFYCLFKNLKIKLLLLFKDNFYSILSLIIGIIIMGLLINFTSLLNNNFLLLIFFIAVYLFIYYLLFVFDGIIKKRRSK